ncbi:hypothetical protein PV327_001211 [Microctonus hyperodae]|uniref:Uncharacterized protein n=1 Tax=Microctonus hyperodae TaxID=165561 RepID=A0AA39G7T6_MICHY|nr:hypothetical protein PV327_001211 [Microctonus hyperodae]
MAIQRVLIFAIIFIISTFTSFYTTNAEIDNDTKNTIDKIVGLWYFVAELNIEPSVPIVECRTLNIQRITQNHLNMSSRSMFDTEYKVYNWKAQIIKNKLYNLKTQDGDAIPEIDQLDIVEDDNFLVLNNNKDAQVYSIYSRTPNITEESLRTYKTTASIEQLYVHYADHRNCAHRSLAQWKFDLNEIYHMTGTWYNVLGICPQVLSYESSCAHMNVTKASDDFISIKTYKEHGAIKYMRNWMAKIFYSDLYEMNSKLLNPPSYTVAYYNNKEELFLHSKMHPACDAIWSRTKFLSDESYEIYRKIAEKKGWVIRHIGHFFC